MTYPIVEFDHTRSAARSASAITGVYVYRADGDHAAARTCCSSATTRAARSSTSTPTTCPSGGQDAIRRILFNDKGTTKTLLQLIKEKNAAQGKPPAPRADLRFGRGPQRADLRAEQARRQ